MSKVLDKAVTGSSDAGWDFSCPGVQGSPCGDEVPFASTGWPSKKVALARGQEHFDEHKGDGVMSSLDDFRTKHKLGVTDDGVAVSLEDL